MLDFLDHLVEEGFVSPRMRELFLVANTPADLMELLKNYEPVHVDKWIEAKDI